MNCQNLLESIRERQSLLCGRVAWWIWRLTEEKILKTTKRSPWKVGQYKNGQYYREAGVDVDEDADVALDLLQLATVNTLYHGSQEKGDTNLSGHSSPRTHISVRHIF